MREARTPDGKPVGIHQHIGRRPIAAFGNPTAILRCCNGPALRPARTSAYTCSTTDDERERAHDRQSSIGRLDKGLDAAGNSGWVVDMKNDRKQVFGFEQ